MADLVIKCPIKGHKLDMYLGQNPSKFGTAFCNTCGNRYLEDNVICPFDENLTSAQKQQIQDKIQPPAPDPVVEENDAEQAQQPVVTTSGPTAGRGKPAS